MQKKAAIEAILFSMGAPLELEKIASALGETKDATKELLAEMTGDYADESRGIRLIELDGSYQLCTKPEYYQSLIQIVSHQAKPVLTEVMMETLSIIAYKQPVTKPEIEKIRGVKSDHVVNRLVEFDLVKELGRLDAPGRPILFGTTDSFLRHFGIESTDQLPEMDSVKLEDFKSEVEAELHIEV